MPVDLSLQVLWGFFTFMIASVIVGGMREIILTVSPSWLMYAEQLNPHFTILRSLLDIETNNGRAHDLASQSDVASNKEQDVWTNGAWVEGIKATPNSAINESASASHLTPRVCVTDSAPLYPLLPKTIFRGRGQQVLTYIYFL